VKLIGFIPVDAGYQLGLRNGFKKYFQLENFICPLSTLGVIDVFFKKKRFLQLFFIFDQY
jgi:hypothetical protein